MQTPFEIFKAASMFQHSTPEEFSAKLNRSIATLSKIMHLIKELGFWPALTFVEDLETALHSRFGISLLPRCTERSRCSNSLAL